MEILKLKINSLCPYFLTTFLFAIENLDFNKIKELVKNKQYHLVIETLKPHEKDIEKNWEIGYYLGIAYFRLKNYHAAINYFEKTLPVSPKKGLIHFNLGTSKYKQKKYSEAIQHFENAYKHNILLEPKARYLLGVCYLKIKDNKKARENFLIVIKKYPISKYAKKSKYALEKLVGVTQKRAYDVSLGFGYNYDSNTNYEPISTYDADGKKDSYLAFSTSLNYGWKILSLNYSLFYSRYFNYNEYDSMQHILGLSHAIKTIPRKISLSSSYSLSYNIYASNPYNYNLKIKLVSSILPIDIKFSYTFSLNKYLQQPYEFLNGIEHLFAVSYSKRIRKGIVSLEYKYRNTNTNDKSGTELTYYYVEKTTDNVKYLYNDYFRSYSYHENSVGIYILYEFFKSVSIHGMVGYAFRVYKEEDFWYRKYPGLYWKTDGTWYYWDGVKWIQTSEPSPEKIQKLKKEGTLNMNLSFTLKLLKNLRLIFGFSYLYNVSTLTKDDYIDKNYKKFVFSSTINFVF